MNGGGVLRYLQIKSFGFRITTTALWKSFLTINNIKDPTNQMTKDKNHLQSLGELFKKTFDGTPRLYLVIPVNTSVVNYPGGNVSIRNYEILLPYPASDEDIITAAHKLAAIRNEAVEAVDTNTPTTKKSVWFERLAPHLGHGRSRVDGRSIRTKRSRSSRKGQEIMKTEKLKAAQVNSKYKKTGDSEFFTVDIEQWRKMLLLPEKTFILVSDTDCAPGRPVTQAEMAKHGRYAVLDLSDIEAISKGITSGTIAVGIRITNRYMPTNGRKKSDEVRSLFCMEDDKKNN